MIETSLLQTLVAIGKNENFSKAAEILGVTQSAVSQNAKNLEQKVGSKLFIRFGKKYRLTREGKKLFDLACEMLTKMEDVVADIRESKDSMSGHLKIGTFSGVGKSWLGPQLINFSAKYPDINVEICLDLSDNLINKFEKYELDCLVIPMELLPQRCSSDLLYQEKAILVFPNSPEFDIAPDIKLEELLTYPMVFFDRSAPLFKKWCLAKYKKIPKNIDGRFIINSHGNILHAVSQGLGVAVVPDHVLKRSFFKGKVKTLGDDFVVPINQLIFVYRDEAMELTRMQKLREMLVENISDVEEQNK